MKDVLFIIDAADIPTAEKLAAQLEGPYRVYVFDPALLDKVKDSALANVELLAWDGALDYPTLVREAHARAHAFEASLDEAAGKAGCPVPIRAWQHLNLFYFFLTHAWYSAMWADILPRLKQVRSYIFLCNNPSVFYWPSFLPSLLLLQYLRTFDIEFTAYPYGDRADESDAIPYLCEPQRPEDACDVLAHLPTCFYDMPYFDSEIQASGRKVTHLVSKYWDVPFAANAEIKMLRTNVHHPILPRDLWQNALDFGEAMYDRIYAQLTPYIATESYRASQARYFANTYRSQFVTFHLLDNYYAPRLPKKLLLSDHDSGFHGPLMGFAEKHALPVVVVPHSKTSEDTQFDYRETTFCTHPIQGAPIRDARGGELPGCRLAYPARLTGPSMEAAPLRRIGLLLNGFSLNGIYCTEWRAYLDGIVRVAAWCRANGIELTVRCRQGQTLYELLEDATGIPRASLEASITGSLAEFAAQVDLCLMYDAPTNADLEFLRNGIPILNPIVSPLSRAEAATANARVVPRDSVEGILDMVEGFVTDPVALQRFRMRQFADFAALYCDARALREML
jgi:hypothetical protein